MNRAYRHFFAYGENMHPDIIRERVAAPMAVSKAILRGFRVDFFGYSRRWDGATETLVRDPRSTVWGVLYRLDFDDCELLDEFMDARLDGAGSHFHYPVEVELPDGSTTDALAYLMSHRGNFRPPTYEYLAVLADALRHHGIPYPYIERLQSTPYCPASYPVPRADKGGRSTSCGDCGDLREVPRKERAR